MFFCNLFSISVKNLMRRMLCRLKLILSRVDGKVDFDNFECFRWGAKILEFHNFQVFYDKNFVFASSSVYSTL